MNTLYEHLHADDGQDQAHHSSDYVDSILSDVFDELLSRDEEGRGLFDSAVAKYLSRRSALATSTSSTRSASKWRSKCSRAATFL
jgi:hypothetical protein